MFAIITPLNFPSTEFLYFIQNLKVTGLEVVTEEDSNMYRISLPDNLVRQYAEMYDLDLEKRYFFTLHNNPLPFMSLNIGRAEIRTSGEISSCERIFILNKILESTRYDDSETEMYGLSKLKRIGLVRDAFPLHDGPSAWRTEDITLNDRQLLSKYWSNFHSWYKEQPLDLIEKYFGPEVAFYYAWKEFYNNMLLYSSIIGVLYFIISVFILIFRYDTISKYICGSDLLMCPVCPKCRYETLSEYCRYSQWMDIFDNSLTIYFGIFILCWAHLFHIYWRRNESRLKLRWTVESEEIDTEFRLEFKESVKQRRVTVLSGEFQPYLPVYKQCFYLTLSVAASVILILLVLTLIVASEYIYETFLVTLVESLFTRVVGCQLLEVIWINILGYHFRKCAVWLTNLEKPRTQSEYDDSVLLKSFVLTFINNFLTVFYIIMLKGRFYTTPNSLDSSYMKILELDSCTYSCIIDLNIHLSFWLVLMRFIGNILYYFFRKINFLIRKRCSEASEAPWLVDLGLEPMNIHIIYEQMTNSVADFTYVVFFSVTFPLTPLLALINNLFEIRLDAHHLVHRLRRPLPRRKAGIGAWNDIITGIIFFSTITNAILIGYTSDFVAVKLYKQRYGESFENFINYTYASFDTTDLIAKSQSSMPRLCYYKAKRLGHDHKRKYAVSEDYWIEFIYRCGFVFLFEYVVLLGAGFCYKFFATTPETVKKQLHNEQLLIKKEKLRQFHENFQELDKEEVEERVKGLLMPDD